MQSYIRHIIKGILLMLTLIVLPLHSTAQQSKCTISGHITDAQNAPIAYASVAVYDDTKAIAGTITDDNGKFMLKVPVSTDGYELAVEFIGYTRHTCTISANKSNIVLSTIVLKEDTIALEGATVTAKEATQKSTVEHTTINATANLASDKGTAIDILRSASSVTISNDEISIRGNTNILVLMDGIPTTASDLSTIPAGNIKSIEVITNPDASHDASGTGGIINIVSKKNSLEGFSGMISANYGFNHFVTANAAFSYNKSKASYRFNYNTKYEDDIVNTTLQRYIKENGYDVQQHMLAARYTYNNNIGFGADFRINPKNRVSLDVKCILPRINIKQDLNNTSTVNTVTSQEARHNDVTWNRENIEGSISYTHILMPEVSDLNVIGSISKIWGHRPSYYYAEGEMINRSNSGGSPFISSLQIDYKHKFKAGTLSAGGKYTYRRNDIYHQFYRLEDGEWKYSDALSNDLMHTESVPAAYVMFASPMNKKFSYKVGLRGELSTVCLRSHHDEVDQTNNSFFIAPSISGVYKISEKQDISLALSRRIGRPTYPQLNPYMSMVDAMTYEQGNMYLRPEKSTKLDLSYNVKAKALSLFINGYLAHTKDYISQITMIDAGRLITTYVNADMDLKSGVDVSMRIEPAKWLNISLSSNTYYVSTEGEFNGAEISNCGVTNNSNIALDFLPWRGGNIQCQYFITTPQYFPQLTTALTHQMNLGVKQKLMKGAMTVSVLLTDVFNTAKWEVSSHNNIFDLTNISRNKSRMLWLGVSYNFNSFKQKSSQKNEADRSLIRLGL